MIKVGDIFELRIRRFFKDGEKGAVPSSSLLLRVNDLELVRTAVANAVAEVIETLADRTYLKNPVQMTVEEINAVLDYEKRESDFVEQQMQQMNGMTRQ